MGITDEKAIIGVGAFIPGGIEGGLVLDGRWPLRIGKGPRAEVDGNLNAPHLDGVVSIPNLIYGQIKHQRGIVVGRSARRSLAEMPAIGAD